MTMILKISKDFDINELRGCKSYAGLVSFNKVTSLVLVVEKDGLLYVWKCLPSEAVKKQ